MTSSELAAWHEDATSFVVPNSDYRVFVKEFGDQAANSQQTLLLLHGFPESSFSYHKVVKGLLRQFDRVVLFDMLGFGFSSKPNDGYSYSLIEQADVALQVWHSLGIEGGHVLSHDMGTSMLTELVARQTSEMLPAWFPIGFHSYTFTNGSMVLKFAKLRRMQKLLLGQFGPQISKATSFRTFAASVRSAHGVKGSNDDALSDLDVQQLWENLTTQEGHRKAHLTIRYLLDRRRFEESRWLSALTIADRHTPIHFCWGDADQVARIEMARYLKDKVCPQAKLSVMPDVGHFCQLGSPETWLHNVGRFYTELSH